MNKKIEIFTCYHKIYDIAKSDVIVPIHVGKALSCVNLNMQGDDTGDNISVKNHFVIFNNNFTHITCNFKSVSSRRFAG